MFEMELGWDRSARCGARPSPHVLRIRITPTNSAVQGLPLRLAIAVDSSSSMEGAMLAHARASCLAVLAQLRPEDQFSLAGFSGAVTPLLTGIPGGAGTRDAAAQAVTGLQATGVTRTDLALEWLIGALPPERGVVRMGVLITDGRPTDSQGQPLPVVTELLDRAARLGDSDITLCTVGLGDAANFNTSFLVDLSDRGRGAFLYADNPEALEPQLNARLAAGQSITAADMRIVVRPLMPGVALTGACRLRPDFVPLELPAATRETSIRPGSVQNDAAMNGEAGLTPDSVQGDAAAEASIRLGGVQGIEATAGEASIRLGGIQGDAPTDVLVSLEAPPAAAGAAAGEQTIVAVRLERDGAPPGSEMCASLLYTDSYVEAQQIDKEINQDRMRWELNVYSQALNRTTDLKQTAALLGDIAHVARKTGQEALAIKATGQLSDLQKGARMDANRATGILIQTRRPGANG